MLVESGTAAVAVARVCGGCGETKPLDLEHWAAARWADKAAGIVRVWRSICRDCASERSRAYYEANKERWRNQYRPVREAPAMRVAIESFRPLWDRILTHARDRFVMDGGGKPEASFATFDTEAFADWLGISRTEYARVIDYMKPSRVDTHTLDFDLCDRILTGAGLTHLSWCLYVVAAS